MPLFYEPSKDAERHFADLSVRLHGLEARCPLVANEFQWEVARGTCCLFDVTGLVALIENELPDFLPVIRRGPSTAEVPLVIERLCWLSKCFQDDGEESLVELETAEVAAAWLEGVFAAGFGARAVMSRVPRIETRSDTSAEVAASVADPTS